MQHGRADCCDGVQRRWQRAAVCCGPSGFERPLSNWLAWVEHRFSQVCVGRTENKKSVSTGPCPSVSRNEQSVPNKGARSRRGGVAGGGGHGGCPQGCPSCRKTRLPHRPAGPARETGAAGVRWLVAERRPPARRALGRLPAVGAPPGAATAAALCRRLKGRFRGPGRRSWRSRPPRPPAQPRQADDAGVRRGERNRD